MVISVKFSILLITWLNAQWNVPFCLKIDEIHKLFNSFQISLRMQLLEEFNYFFLDEREKKKAKINKDKPSIYKLSTEKIFLTAKYR